MNVFALAALSTAIASEDAISLVPAKTGQQATYELRLHLTNGRETAQVLAKVVERTIRVDTNGGAVIERWLEDAEGTEATGQTRIERREPRTFELDPFGRVLRVTRGSSDIRAIMLASVTRFVYPSMTAPPGSSWENNTPTWNQKFTARSANQVDFDWQDIGKAGMAGRGSWTLSSMVPVSLEASFANYLRSPGLSAKLSMKRVSST